MRKYSKKLYRIRMRYTFEGDYIVEASHGKEAIEKIEEQCGLVLGKIHSTLPEEELNWEFPTHPQKKILRATRIG